MTPTIRTRLDTFDEDWLSTATGPAGETHGWGTTESEAADAARASYARLEAEVEREPLRLAVDAALVRLLTEDALERDRRWWAARMAGGGR